MLALLGVALLIHTRSINGYSGYDDNDELSVYEDLWTADALWDSIDKFSKDSNEIIRKCAFNFDKDICLCYNQHRNQFFSCDKENTDHQLFNAYEAYSDYYDTYYRYEGGEGGETDFDQIKSGEGALVWTGFDIQWQNRMKIAHAKGKTGAKIGGIAAGATVLLGPLVPGVLLADALSKGFMTPHRISKLGSYIDSEQLRAYYSFGPGVDGDYAYPLTKYKSVIISENTRIGAQFGKVTLEFSDTAEDDVNTQYPMADTGLVESELIAKPAEIDGTIHSEIVLNGFELEAECDKERAKDAPENKQTCNSNGTWPYIWDIGVKAEEDGSGWKAFVRIARSKNTAKSKGAEYKPFNYFMNYVLDVYYTVFSGKQADSLFSTQSELITGKDEMNDGKGTEAKFMMAGQKKTDDYVVGINKFKFTLSNPEDMGTKYPRGRYFEGLVYGIDDESLHYNDDNGEVTGNVYMNVYGAKAAGKKWPATTKKSIVDYEMGLTLLQFASETTKVGDDEGALGSICQSGNDDPMTSDVTEKSTDFGMDCKAKRINLPERLKGSVSIQRIQLIPEPGSVKCKCFGKKGSMSPRVCGEDGITYANRCIAACYCANVVHKGKCKSLLMQDIVVKNNKKGQAAPICPGSGSPGSGKVDRRKRNADRRADRRAARVRKTKERQLRRRANTLKRRKDRRKRKQGGILKKRTRRATLRREEARKRKRTRRATTLKRKKARKKKRTRRATTWKRKQARKRKRATTSKRKEARKRKRATTWKRKQARKKKRATTSKRKEARKKKRAERRHAPRRIRRARGGRRKRK